MYEKLDLPSPPAGPAEPHPQVFACTLRADGLDMASVRAIGELDISTAPGLEQLLRRAELRARLITLDLRELTFMDGVGLHVIVHASIRARRLNRRLILLRGPSQVDRLVEVTGASAVLEIRDLSPHEPPVQLLLQLARPEHPPEASPHPAAVRARECGSTSIEVWEVKCSQSFSSSL